MAATSQPAPQDSEIKGALKNLQSRFKAGHIPTKVMTLKQKEDAALENYEKIQGHNVERGSGIVSIRTSGVVVLDNPESALLREQTSLSADKLNRGGIKVRKKWV